MNKFIKRIIAIFCIAVIGIGSSANAWGNKAKTNSPSASEIQKHAYDRSTIATFDVASAVLSEVDKARIRDLVSFIGSGNISRIEVAAWSDKPFPKTGTDLLKTDRDLADQRAKNLNDFIKDELNISTLRITLYNMAETSNWLARTFRTNDAELKSVFAKEAVAPMARADFNLIAREGAPSRAVVVVVQK